MSVYSNLNGPYEISIDITNMCNLRCLHCYNHSGDNLCISNELTDDEIIDLILDVIKLKPINVCLAGGEPLLRKNIVIKALSLLSENNILTSMVSNGILVDEGCANSLKNAGISRIQISLDGLEQSHDKLRNKKGAYKSVEKCLMILQKKGINTYLGFVPTKWNIDDFDEIVNLAIDRGIKGIRTQYIMPNGRGMVNYKKIRPSEHDYRKLLFKINTQRRRLLKEGINLTIDWDDPVQHFIDICDYKSIYPQIHIKANGNVSFTPYLPISFGNIRNKSITELIRTGILDSIKNDLFIDICRKIRCVDNLSLEGMSLPQNFQEEDISITI